MLHRSVLIAAIFGLLARGSSAQTPADSTTTAPPPAGLSRLSPEFKTVMHVPDLHPHLRRLLASDGLRGAFTTGKLPRALAAMSAQGPPPDPARWVKWMDENDRHFPAEALVALSGSGYENFGRLLHVVLLASLCEGALKLGEEAPSGALAALQSELEQELRAYRAPGLAVWFRLRRPEDTQKLFKLMAEYAPATFLAGGQAETGANATVVRFAISRLASSEMLVGVLVELGVLAGPDDPAAKGLSDAVAALELEARVERLGDALLFSVGPIGGTQSVPMVEHRLSSLWQPSQDQLLYSHWDMTPLRNEVRRSLEVWRRWADTPIGRKAAELDENDFIGSIETTARQLDSYSPTGALRAFLSEEGIDITATLDTPRAAPDLRSTPLLEWLPASAEVISLDATQSLAEILSGMFLEAEDRLDRQLLKAELTGNERRSEKLRQVHEFYYRDMARLRELIYRDSVEVFEPPTAAFVRLSGKLDPFSVTVEGLPNDGKIMRMQTMRVPEVLLVARVRKEDAALELVGKLEQAFADAVATGLGLESRKVERSALDLGLGVPTYRVASDVFRRVLEAPVLGRLLEMEEADSLRVDMQWQGDLQLHSFVRDGYLVLSSSPRLSADLMAAVSAKPGARQEPRPLGGGHLVGYGRFPLSTASQSFEMLASWLRLAAGESNGGSSSAVPMPAGPIDPKTSEQLNQAADLFEGFPQLLGLVDDLQWTAVDGPAGRVWHEKVRWKP